MARWSANPTVEHKKKFVAALQPSSPDSTNAGEIQFYERAPLSVLEQRELHESDYMYFGLSI